ncbi:MAG TPA: type II secretion system protein [Holophagaceae bacterium]|nr:type II secretion system protein [Holophagaceae bacterium]
MKKQSGFTLIELLLVLAIIGIISAIAIPALLNQRARARDKAAIQNTFSRVAELASQADALKDAQAPVVAGLTAYLTANTANSKNPWAGSGGMPANSPAVQVAVTDLGVVADKAAFDLAVEALSTVGTLGQAQFGIALPAPGSAGFVGGSVYLYTPNTGTRGAGSQVAFTSVAVE